MQPRLSSLNGYVWTFADRGASVRARGNTREAFELAAKAGVNGLASEVWTTADGAPVLHGDRHVGPRFRRKPIASLTKAELPSELCSLDELVQLGERGLWLSLSVGDAAALSSVMTTIAGMSDELERRLLVSFGDIDQLAQWRSMTSAQLVLSTQIRRVEQTPEQLAAELQRLEIDGISLPRADWSAGLIAVMHRFDRYALATGLEHEREFAALIDIGIDGVYSGHVNRMVAVANHFT